MGKKFVDTGVNKIFINTIAPATPDNQCGRVWLFSVSHQSGAFVLFFPVGSKMYVVKLCSTFGVEANRGLKGNTITFPQDVVQIAAKLPANPDILAVHLSRKT